MCKTTDVLSRGSKYPIFEVSGSKTNYVYGCWNYRLETGDWRYLDPLGSMLLYV